MSSYPLCDVDGNGLPNLREAVFYDVDGQSCFGVIIIFWIKIFQSAFVGAGFMPAR